MNYEKLPFWLKRNLELLTTENEMLKAENEFLIEMIGEQEYRLCLIELGVEEI